MLSSFRNINRPALLAGLILAILLAGCGSSTSSNAPAAIEAYLQALVSEDANQITALSCADWESQARQELDSFAAVTAELQDLKCQESGQEGDQTLVACQGKILASYNGENQELPLGDRVYRAVNEGGEWRMCGYR